MNQTCLFLSLLFIIFLLHVVNHVRAAVERKRIASSVVYSWDKPVATSGIIPPEAMPTDWVSSFFHKVNITLISAGKSHSVAVGPQEDETLIYAWGNNDHGQLGDETFMSRSLPSEIDAFLPPHNPVSQISCGHNHNLILRRDGKLYSWGLNQAGQLGDQTWVNQNRPVSVFMEGALNGTVITQVSAGDSHSLALTNDGRIFAWGDNFSGQLGVENTQDSPVPVAVNMSAFRGKMVIQVAASTYHSVALTSDGTVYYWGDESVVGGNGQKKGSLIPVAVDMSRLQGNIVTQIAVGYLHTVLLTNNSKIYSWGSNRFGQLGSGSYQDELVPVAVKMSGELSEKTVVQIAAGGYHTLALTSDGLLYGWGNAQEGQLGRHTSSAYCYPTLLNINNELNDSITQIVAGEAHTMILTSKGKSYSMGKNEDGQLGDGTKVDRHQPIAIGMNGALNGKTITSIVARQYPEQYVALTKDGNMYSWGSNSAGQVGDGTRNSKNFPVMVDKSGILNDKIISQVTLGCLAFFVLARSEDGMLYSWGSNIYGQIGDGSYQERHQPVAVFMDGVLSGKTITTASAGRFHVVALANDTMMYAWGLNVGGRLGDGSAINRKEPVSVVMKGDLKRKRVVQIAAGDVHTVALTSDGTLFSWGFNRCGMLGNDTLRFVSVPDAVSMGGTLKDKNITFITAGEFHTTILTRDGHIYSWGLTDFGAPFSVDDVPVRVSMNGLLNEETVSQFIVNDFDMLALTNGGKLGYWNMQSNYSTWVNMNNVDSEQTLTSFFIGANTMGFLGVICEQGYFGKECDLFNCFDIEREDETRVCSGNGVCVDFNKCECNEGFTGLNCSYPICHGYSSVDTKVCSSHGTCRNPNTCFCAYGYHGDTCGSSLKLLWILVILGVLSGVSLVVSIIVIGVLIRRRRRDERMKSELRACLLEEMSDYEVTSFERGDFFIDMRDIKLISRISEGAFGVVFKGEWKSNAVAVKKMKVSDDESFVKEVSILQSLRHPNILYLYGYSSNDNGDKFLITEFAVNGSLDKVLHSSNVKLKPFDQKMNILCQIADTMAYLHGRSPRIVHRDLKPQNILLGENYHVRICDFGLSKSTDTSFTMGKSYGTIEYCAPELLTHREHDETCDTYSFGIIMHEIFILDAPYCQISYSSVFTLGLDIVRGLRPPIPSNDSQALLNFFSKSNTTNIPSSDIPSIVQDFYSIATRCWSADKTKRPSFEEITTELDKIKRRSENF